MDKLMNLQKSGKVKAKQNTKSIHADDTDKKNIASKAETNDKNTKKKRSVTVNKAA